MGRAEVRVFAALLAAFVLLAGCAARTTLAPVSDRSISAREPTSAYRTVVPGDTLYSIAWESGRDYKELARWNRIAPPYTIKPGDRIHLYPPRDARPTKARKRVRMHASPPYRRHARADRPVKIDRSSPRLIAWMWPAHGKVVGGYYGNGIDIAGRRGEDVRAAAGGRVVYSGSGLRGYGRLIILKHNDDYLSAYAHNDKVYVKEGDVIKRGQKIADMGSSGTDRVVLHFEIRRRGVPVDPLRYLPRQ